MADDAYYLIVHTHGKLLRSMATCLGVHCEGLQQAGRIAKARKLISTKQARRLVHFDITYNLLRHISSVSAGKFCMDILSSVAAVGAEGVLQPLECAAVGPPLMDDICDLSDKCDVAPEVVGDPVQAAGVVGLAQPSGCAELVLPVMDKKDAMNDKCHVELAVAGGAEGQARQPQDTAIDANTISDIISGLIESIGNQLQEKLTGTLQEASLTIAHLREELNSTREENAEVLKAMEVRLSAVRDRVSAHEAALGWPKGAT
eukprot:TRINITY_DN24408_c0_g1_i2.p1 TRINITY_DN24408_c0_g1~~TRINITY_DN24408_c0_g1_i2.p1  ORF type:complete len:292 (-),score=62.51 TRINITY_DN24408_c0_g1_i2:12-791(-)